MLAAERGIGTDRKVCYSPMEELEDMRNGHVPGMDSDDASHSTDVDFFGSHSSFTYSSDEVSC